MEKKNLGVIFGGMSTENEVSIVSATSVLNNLDKNKYRIYPIYIEKNGEWCELENKEEERKFNFYLTNRKKIENIVKYIKQMDIVFPVLHGLYGEDGTIQGLFELLKIPYVGCGVLSSSIGMDKIYSKIIFSKAGLKQAKYEYIRAYKGKYIYVDQFFNEKIVDMKQVAEIISGSLKFPMFVKPSNSGSSIGVNKVNNLEELQKCIEYAERFDSKVLIEEGIEGREVECAVIGNQEVVASCVGEVKSAEDFYSYDAKYKNKNSRTDIPANISLEISEKIKEQAIKAFKSIDGKGLARVDFFIKKETNQVYINEINTMPGFTNISMYPKLFAKSGISYKELLNKLIYLETNKIT